MDEGRGTMEACEPTRLFEELAGRATRRTIWQALLHAVARCGAREAQVVERMPDRLEVVATRGRAAEASLGVPDAEIVTWVLRHGKVRIVPAGSASGDGATVLLPIRVRGEVVAVLRALRQDAWTSRELEALATLGFAVSARLTERAWALQSCLTSQLTEQVAESDDLAAAAQVALEAIVPAVSARSGAILETRAERLVLLADHGEGAWTRRRMVADGIPFGEGVAWQVVASGEHHFTRAYRAEPDALASLPVDPVLLMLPLERRSATRAVLVLSFEASAVPPEADVAILRGVIDVLALQLQGLREDRAQERMLRLLSPLATLGGNDLYQRALDGAIDSIPGAQYGSLLVWDRAERTFRYRAASGYDLAVLGRVRMSDDALRLWYDPDTLAWDDARPRVATASSGRLRRTSDLASAGAPVEAAAKLDTIRANLCIPITVDGRVRAVVNLESVVREDAFGPDSLRIARQGAVVGASLLRVGIGLGTLQAAASTDPLTGLPNRRRASEELARALARARRDDRPLSVLVMDLADFKAINDEHGHAAGDEALANVARTLRDHVREGDLVARWGGDEFIAILPDQSSRTVAAASRRLERAVRELRVGRALLAIHIGSASFPTDAIAADDLLATADARMYATKRDAQAAGVAR